jgi:hypothetical protein
MPNAPLIREESQFVVDAERYYVGESGVLNLTAKAGMDKTMGEQPGGGIQGGK